MTQDEEAGIERAAVAWFTRTQDTGFADWDDWARWMAADPRHAEVYWRLAVADADMLDAVRPAAADPAARRRPVPIARRALIGAGLAAAAVALAFGAWTYGGADPVEIRTGAGETRRLALADGRGTAWLNGDTVLQIDRRRSGRVVVVAGEVLFDVQRDGLEVRAGDAEIRDIGTVFNVARDGDAVRVAVAEGQVRFRSGSLSVELGAGDRLREAQGRIRRGRVDVALVGGWREDRLDWDAVPLREVAADLSRRLGVPVVVDPSVAAVPVSGAVRLRGERAAVRPRLEAALGVRIREDAAGWRIGPAAAGTP